MSDGGGGGYRVINYLPLYLVGAVAFVAFGFSFIMMLVSMDGGGAEGGGDMGSLRPLLIGDGEVVRGSARPSPTEADFLEADAAMLRRILPLLESEADRLRMEAEE